MQDCLFCKMAAGDIPVSKVYEDDTVLAFHDIDPQAPVHFLVSPKHTSLRLPPDAGEQRGGSAYL